jgi:hypothetical protein
MVMKILTAINIIGLLQSKRRPHHKRASLTLEARPRPQGVKGQGANYYCEVLRFSGRALSVSLRSRSELIADRLIRSEIEFTGSHDAAMRQCLPRFASLRGY